MSVGFKISRGIALSVGTSLLLDIPKKCIAAARIWHVVTSDRKSREAWNFPEVLRDTFLRLSRLRN